MKIASGLENNKIVMLSGQNIIYFGPEKWDGMWRNRQQLMSRFARKNKVMHVEPKEWDKSPENTLKTIMTSIN